MSFHCGKLGKVEKQNYPRSGCCGVAIAAVAVNHSSIQLANESARGGFSQQTIGCDPAHMEVSPGQDDSMLLLCFDENHKGITIGTRFKASSDLLFCNTEQSLQSITFTAMKESQRHVEGCREKDSSDVLHHMKYQVKDNKGKTKRN